MDLVGASFEVGPQAAEKPAQAGGQRLVPRQEAERGQQEDQVLEVVRAQTGTNRLQHRHQFPFLPGAARAEEPPGDRPPGRRPDLGQGRRRLARRLLLAAAHHLGQDAGHLAHAPGPAGLDDDPDRPPPRLLVRVDQALAQESHPLGVLGVDDRRAAPSSC
jgi:hypothetical protein